jgi:hypothetical protein
MSIQNRISFTDALITMETSKANDVLQVKDAYTLYEEGKKRRYSLLFSVNGGALSKCGLVVEN